MRQKLRRPLAAALVAGALAAHAAAARAEELDPGLAEGPKTLAKYVGCATGLALAIDPGSAFLAFMACLKMFLDEFPH